MAIRVWNLLANGSGGIDWAGFGRVVDHYGIKDEDALIQRLRVIRTHVAPDDRGQD